MKYDIWYESISQIDAKTGLQELAEQENKTYSKKIHDTLISNTVVNYPVDAVYPSNWAIETEKSIFSRGRDIEFTSQTGGFSVRMYDLGTG